MEKILELPADKQYIHCIKRIIGFQEAWGLYKNGEGWVIASSDSEEKMFSIWPDKKYASICIKDLWKDSIPKKISLDGILLDLLQWLRKEKMLLSIFPHPDSLSIQISPNIFEVDITEEMEKYP